jgi:hypothetical protein
LEPRRLRQAWRLRHALTAVAVIAVSLAPAAQADPQAPGVRIVDNNARAVTFQNADGKWTIFKACLGPRAHGGNATVGPGYIARVERDNHNGTFTTIVDDERPYRSINSPAAGGLGTFGSHVASKNGIGNAVQALTNERAWFVDGRRCAGDDWIESRSLFAGSTGIGVAGARIVEGPAVVAGAGRLAIDVDFKDNQSPGALVTVRYRYRIQPSNIRLWTTVTPTGAFTNRLEFIKEPKFGFAISGGGYRRISILTRGGSLAKNALPSNHRQTVGGNPSLCYWVGPAASNDRVTRTGQCDADTRYRLRFDFNGSYRSPQAMTPAAQKLALSVVGMSAARPDNVGSPTALFEQPAGGAGIGSWGERVRTERGRTVQQYAAQDSAMGGAKWGCHVGGPNERAYWQRWELIGGVKDKAGNYTAASALLKGWDGGTGAYDCEPLSMHDSRAGRYGNFFSISIGSGWTSS